jgi:hypothetical protein
MNYSGLCRASLVSLLVLGQFAGANLVISAPGQNSAAQKPLLKIDKDAPGQVAAQKATDQEAGKSKPLEKSASPNNHNSLPSEAKNKPIGHPGKTHAGRTAELVPPPPAFQPSFLLNSGGIGMPMQVEYMSKEAAAQRFKDIQKQITDAKSDMEDKQAQLKEKKERSERFASLYTEGVVSRHELEAAAKEAGEYEKEVKRFQDNLAELESEKSALSDRIKPTNKQASQVKRAQNYRRHRSIGAKP